MKRFVYTNLLLALIFASAFLSREDTFPSSIEVSKSSSPSPAPVASFQPSPSPTQELTGESTPNPTPVLSARPSPTPGQSSTSLNAAVNSFRQANLRASLVIDNTICSWAQERVNELASNFFHDGFDNGDPLGRLGASGAAENIASTAKGPSYIVNEMWAKSAGHKENMLGDYTRGCGVYKGRYGVYIFAR